MTAIVHKFKGGVASEPFSPAKFTTVIAVKSGQIALSFLNRPKRLF
jgi:hypothetical protein